MKSSTGLSLSCIWALALACSGSTTWEDACPPAWIHLANDLKVLTPNGSADLTPDLIKAKVEAFFISRQLPVTLENVRSIGAIFHDACSMANSGDIRCTFWLWSDGNENRGIEVRMQYDASMAPTSSVESLTSRYVFEVPEPTGCLQRVGTDREKLARISRGCLETICVRGAK